MQNYLVSVVVPIYKVEQYLETCVKSILQQKYTNLEVILVDDGSPDLCGKLCDQYALEDNRIVVIHQKNGGLSNARNNGLKVAHGRYITFIDSDDFISTNMISDMVELAVAKDISLVCCDYTSNINELSNVEADIPQIMSKSVALEHLLDPTGYRCFAWNKLYSLDLFQDIKYPEGKLFEDIATTYELMKKIDKIAYIKKKLYFYRVRNDSISNNTFSERNYDLLEAIDYVKNDCSLYEKKSYDGLVAGYLVYYLWFVNQTVLGGICDKKKEKELKKNIWKNTKRFILSRTIDKKQKIELVTFAISPVLYRSIYRRMKGVKNG